MKQQKQKSHAGKALWWMIFLVAAGVFIFAAYQLITILLEYKKGTDEYKDLQQYAITQNDDNPDESGDDAVPAGPEIDFAALKAINEDIVGWLEVEALDISYPIVQGKDNEYYLHQTFKKTYNFAGSIFLEAQNKADFSDCNSIVYGHNMKNGSMFGTLKQFRSRETYDQSKYFWVCTPEKNYRYEIFSASEVSVESNAYTLFSGPGEEFAKFLENMKAQSLLTTDEVALTEADKVVTLSTCTGDSSTRFIVQGKRMN